MIPCTNKSRTWRRKEPGNSSRPCSEWQLLRSGGTRRACRSAELLQSFQNKVGPPFPVDESDGERPATANDDPTLQQQQRRQPHQPQHEQWQQETQLPVPLSAGGHDDNLRCEHPRYLSEPGDDSPPSSTLRLASVHTRPASSSWVHRRSLPSLLVDRVRSPSWKNAMQPASRGSSSEGPMPWNRGKRRTPLEEPSGLMQRLDQTPPVTVGDAWGGGSAARGSTGRHRNRASDESVGVVAPGRRTGASAPSGVEVVRVLDRRRGATAVGHPDRGSRGSASSGKLLSNAAPKPLLYVGTGGGFRFRS